MYFFALDQPVAIVVIGAISVVHSLFHVPHFLMYRRFGILTAFWSLVGVGLIFGVIMEYETFFITWIWYSCIYLPIMLISMSVKLTSYIFELDLKPWRIVLGMVAVLFYLLMLYSVAYVYEEKLAIFATTSATTKPMTAAATEITTTKSTPGLLRLLNLPLHSLFHLPHFLMYRRLGILTGCWSLLGATLVYGAIMEYEFFYAMFVWYSCVYLPVMLISMSIMLTTYVFELDMKPYRIAMGVISICFYLFMVYCVIFVYEEKLRLFATTTNSTTSTTKSMTTVTTTSSATTTAVVTPPPENVLDS